MREPVALVRVTGSSELDGVLAVDRESFPHPWTRRMYEDDLRNPHSQIWAARNASGVTVGYCAIWVVVDELHINNVAVRQAWRGRGLGELLVKHVLAIGLSAGVATASLEVRRSNIPARRLYARLGFAECGVRNAYYEDPPDDALVLRLPIQTVGAGSGT